MYKRSKYFTHLELEIFDRMENLKKDFFPSDQNDTSGERKIGKRGEKRTIISVTVLNHWQSKLHRTHSSTPAVT